MSKKRVQYSSEFKAKVALAAIRGEETLPQLAYRYGIHPTQINSWKRHLVGQAAELFARSDGAVQSTRRLITARTSRALYAILSSFAKTSRK